jgi:hypothetical protein
MESRTSWTSAAAASGEKPGGGSCREMSMAWSRACGSARSFIQPWSSHSRMAPASWSTDIAQPRGVQIALLRSCVDVIGKAPSPGGILHTRLRSSLPTKGGMYDRRDRRWIGAPKSGPEAGCGAAKIGAAAHTRQGGDFAPNAFWVGIQAPVGLLGWSFSVAILPRGECLPIGWS